MSTRPELENNIKKIQLLINNAQSELQKQTFRDILTDLKKELDQLTTQENSVAKPEAPQVDTPPKTPRRINASTISDSTDLTQIEGSSNIDIDSPQSSNQKLLETSPTPTDRTQIESSSSQDKDSKSTAQLHPPNPPITSKIFQGIGVIEGEIIKDESLGFYHLIYQGKSYKLLIRKVKLRKIVDNNYPFNSPKILVVYPYTKYNPELESGHEIGFTLVRIKDEWSPQAKNHLGLDINEFKLCGFWQKRHGDISVISVHRNRLKKGVKKLLKNATSSRKIKIVTNVPLLWSNPPVEAVFKGEGEGRYFVEVKAHFVPEKEQWEFLELLSEPSLEHPPFVRYPKRKTVSTQTNTEPPENPSDNSSDTQCEIPTEIRVASETLKHDINLGFVTEEILFKRLSGISSIGTLKTKKYKVSEDKFTQWSAEKDIDNISWSWFKQGNKTFYRPTSNITNEQKEKLTQWLIAENLLNKKTEHI